MKQHEKTMFLFRRQHTSQELLANMSESPLTSKKRGQNEHQNIMTQHQNAHTQKRAVSFVCAGVCVYVCVCVHRNQRVFEAVELRLHRGLRFF